MDAEIPEEMARHARQEVGSKFAEVPVVIDKKRLRARVWQQRLKRAGPWTPLSGEYLNTKEFLFLFDGCGDEREYREALFCLRIASSGSRNHLVPEYLRAMFRDGVVSVDMVGRTRGAIAVEYRVPIQSLDEKYVRVAKLLVHLRSKRLDQCLDDATFRKLVRLSLESDKTIPEIITASVEAFFAHSVRQEL